MLKTLRRPNILYLYTDQLRLDALSCYGNTAIETPNIDKLARSGAKLTQYFVNNPVCSPSRMSFLTGRYCSSLRAMGNGIPFPTDAMPLQKLLSPYGYKTAQIGKLHFDPHARRDHKNPTQTYGFDTFILSDEPGCYDDAYTKWVEAVAPEQLEYARTALPPAALHYKKPSYSEQGRSTHEPYIFAGSEDVTHTAFVASETCNFINNYEGNNPFFLIAGFYAPHTPVNPPKKYLDRVCWDKIKMPVKSDSEKWEPYLEGLSEERWKEIVAYYYALVLHVDEYVGHIINCLEAKGLRDDTIIVFTSDHGEYLGDHGKIQKGMPGFDCITNVPMIISYPKLIEGGITLDGLTEGVDIVPTMLDFAAVQTPTYVQGTSIKDALTGSNGRNSSGTNGKTSVIIESLNADNNPQTAIRTNRYMYYINGEGDELLFDVQEDPHQINNIASDKQYADVLSELRKQLILKIQHAAYVNLEATAEY